MRINIYSQEITPETALVSTTDHQGIQFHGARVFLASPTALHNRPDDDDRSAVTFWIPKSQKNREMLALTLTKLAHLVVTAPPSGSD